MVRVFCDKCGKEMNRSNYKDIAIRTDCNDELHFYGLMQLCDTCKKTFEAEMEYLFNRYNCEKRFELEK